MNHLTISGVRGQPVASCHDIFIALLKHITACILSRGILLTVACILAGRELPHAQDWQATFMMDNIIYSYICTCIHTSVKHRVHEAPRCKAAHSNMMGWFLSKSNTKLLDANESWVWVPSYHQSVSLLVLGERPHVSFFDSHLCRPLMAAEHSTGLDQPATTWRRDVSNVEANVIQIIFLIDKYFWLLYYLYESYL